MENDDKVRNAETQRFIIEYGRSTVIPNQRVMQPFDMIHICWPSMLSEQNFKTRGHKKGFVRIIKLSEGRFGVFTTNMGNPIKSVNLSTIKSERLSHM